MATYAILREGRDQEALDELDERLGFFGAVDEIDEDEQANEIEQRIAERNRLLALEAQAETVA